MGHGSLKKLEGPILGSLNEGFIYYGSILGAADCWKLPYGSLNTAYGKDLA